MLLNDTLEPYAIVAWVPAPLNYYSQCLHSHKGLTKLKS